MAKVERTVAITGIGMIHCLGCSAAECWEQMVRGRSGIARITRFDASECITQIGGELPDRYYEMEKAEFSKRMFKQTQMGTRLGLLCAKEAISDSDFSVEGHDPYRCAVITGSGARTWDGRGDDGAFAAPGTYFARLTAGEERRTARPSAPREYGVGPAPLSWSVWCDPSGATVSPRLIALPSPSWPAQCPNWCPP